MNSEIILRFLLAALWGGIVGAEREYRSKSAGFRTLMMISVGSCFFTIMSMQIGAPGNMDRIASNIVTGIGFLGAGVIFRGENRVSGITTAATIWSVAAVGMGIGGGFYMASAVASVLILIMLTIMPWLEAFIDSFNQGKTYTVVCDCTDDYADKITPVFKQCKLNSSLVSVVREGMDLTTVWQANGHAAGHQAFIKAMIADKRFRRFVY